MPVILTITEDTPGVSLVINESLPDIVVSSATTPGPQGIQGIQGIPGTNGMDANWAAYTQVDYDAIPVPDPQTLYIIIPA